MDKTSKRATTVVKRHKVISLQLSSPMVASLFQTSLLHLHLHRHLNQQMIKASGPNFRSDLWRLSSFSLPFSLCSTSYLWISVD